MWTLIPLLFVPLAIAVFFWFSDQKNFTVKEFLLLEVAMSGVLTCGFFIARSSAMSDTELWSGRITAKHHGTQACCHCHQECDTCPDNDGKGSHPCNCHEVCAHIQDYWWSLSVSTGDDIDIESCSGSGIEPRAYTLANVEEGE